MCSQVSLRFRTVETIFSFSCEMHMLFMKVHFYCVVLVNLYFLNVEHDEKQTCFFQSNLVFQSLAIFQSTISKYILLLMLFSTFQI